MNVRVSSTSRLLIEKYLKGRELLFKSPTDRDEEELAFLQGWLMDNFCLFSQISAANLQWIVKKVVLRTFFTGEVIYEQEEHVHNFYMVLRGSVSLMVDSSTQTSNILSSASTSRRSTRAMSKISVKKVERRETTTSKLYGKEIGRLCSGEFFGEESLLQKEENAPHTVRTNEEVELLVINKHTFEKCLHQHFQNLMLKRAEFLANLEWFRNWTPNLLRQLTFVLRERRYSYGDTLYRQGMEMEMVKFIQSGSVRISTQLDACPPEELVEKIQPPKDFLPEILGEDQSLSQEKTVSKISVHSSDPSKVSLAPEMFNLQAHEAMKKSRLSTRKSFISIPLIPTLMKKEENASMEFIVHQPSPEKNLDICLLGPGDMLCDMEAICKLRHNLFNAVSESETVIYEMNTFFFNMIFQKVPRTLRQMTLRALQRVEVWSALYTSIQLFHPLSTVLSQREETLLSHQSTQKNTRKRPLYTPNDLALMAVKVLGKLLPQEPPEVQINIKTLPSTSSSNNATSQSPIPHSPFEPDLGSSMAVCPLHPRFLSTMKRQQDESIFDTVIRLSTSLKEFPNFKSHIPQPIPYRMKMNSPDLPIILSLTDDDDNDDDDDDYDSKVIDRSAPPMWTTPPLLKMITPPPNQADLVKSNADMLANLANVRLEILLQKDVKARLASEDSIPKWVPRTRLHIKEDKDDDDDNDDDDLHQKLIAELKSTREVDGVSTTPPPSPATPPTASPTVTTSALQSMSHDMKMGDSISSHDINKAQQGLLSHDIVKLESGDITKPLGDPMSHDVATKTPNETATVGSWSSSFPAFRRKSSYSIENELVTIPNDYASLLGSDGDKYLHGCRISGRGGREERGKSKKKREQHKMWLKTPPPPPAPKVKTLAGYIKNERAAAKTKYRLSLADLSAAVHRNRVLHLVGVRTSSKHLYTKPELTYHHHQQQQQQKQQQKQQPLQQQKQRRQRRSATITPGGARADSSSVKVQKSRTSLPEGGLQVQAHQLLTNTQPRIPAYCL